jgi:hypothetical protein
MGLYLSPRFLKLGVFSICTVLVGRCSAPQTAPEPKIDQRNRLAEDFIRGKLPLWQHRLHLQDWNVTVLSVHRTDLREHTLGNIHWDKEKRTGVIRVLNASEYGMPFQATLNDIEFTIVHELIHLEMASLPRSEASRSDEEHAINRLAAALIQFEQRDKPAPGLGGPLPPSSNE